MALRCRPRAIISRLVAFQGKLWAIGGRTSFLGTQFPTVEIYDPATNSWSTGVPLPTGRGGLAAAVLGDRVYVFGGEAPLRIFSANEMYGSRRQPLDRQGPDAHAAPRHRRGGGRPAASTCRAAEPSLDYATTTVNEAYEP